MGKGSFNVVCSGYVPYKPESGGYTGGCLVGPNGTQINWCTCDTPQDCVDKFGDRQGGDKVYINDAGSAVCQPTNFPDTPKCADHHDKEQPEQLEHVFVKATLSSKNKLATLQICLKVCICFAHSADEDTINDFIVRMACMRRAPCQRVPHF